MLLTTTLTGFHKVSMTTEANTKDLNPKDQNHSQTLIDLTLHPAKTIPENEEELISAWAVKVLLAMTEAFLPLRQEFQDEAEN